MTTTKPRAIQVGDRSVPVVLPTWRDPRLHTAAVIISVHVLGITALGFRVSVPQILSAIVAAALVDVLWNLSRHGALVWPASGMLTGSGVALILRLVAMGRGDYGSWSGWYYFAVIAGLSVLSNHVIRFRVTHLFNPSNIGLVVAFLVLGSTVIEPLDFWWAPPNFWMILAYVIIVSGGILITRRLRLFEMALVFWLVLAAALGVLSLSGHCMTAAWALQPVCGSDFWSVLVTSPEVLIFVFFMITDPKTVPTGRRARVAFATCLAILATLMMAPQTVEYGAKVALLGSLVLMTPIRELFDRLREDASEQAGAGSALGPIAGSPGRSFVTGVTFGSAVVLVVVFIVLAGSPAREQVATADASGVTDLSIDVDSSDLPSVTAHSDVFALSGGMGQADVDDLAVTLAENLAIEGEAVRRGDGSLLAGADAGDRLVEMQRVIDEAIATGVRVVPVYTFDTLSLSVTDAGEAQSGAALVFDGSGTVRDITHDALGVEQTWTTSSFSGSFVMRQIGGDRWLIVGGSADRT